VIGQRGDVVRLRRDHRGGDGVTLPEPEPDMRDVLAAVACRREQLVHLRAVDRALLELQALGDRERGRRPAEQAEDEQDREEARHGRRKS
jgi:hypothetical protein